MYTAFMSRNVHIIVKNIFLLKNDNHYLNPQ